jgi:malonyl-CoA/methylmalonyl-CoA synthetase
MSANFFDLVRRACLEPNKIFLKTTEGRILTCVEMFAMTGRLANILVLSGVEPDDRVAVQVEKTPENLLLYLATLRAGAVYVALDTAFPLAEVGEAIVATGAKIVVCDPVKREGLAPIAEKHRVSAVETLDALGGGMLMDAAAKAPSEFADVPREGDDLAAIFYASGTGGGRRAARITHRELATRAQPLIGEGRFIDLLSMSP